MTLPSPDAAWSTQLFEQNFANCHDEFAAAGDGVKFYRVRYCCPEAMELTALVGYDGPVAVWADGKLVHSDPAGTNPASALDALVEVPGTVGEHTVMIGLGANSGRAWGVFLRFERTGLDADAVAADPGLFPLPALG